MKFEDEIRFLRKLGLAAIMPGGQVHPISRRLRSPRAFIQVRVIKNGALPKELQQMIQRTRAAYRKSRSTRNAD